MQPQNQPEQPIQPIEPPPPLPGQSYIPPDPALNPQNWFQPDSPLPKSNKRKINQIVAKFNGNKKLLMTTGAGILVVLVLVTGLVVANLNQQKQEPVNTVDTPEQMDEVNNQPEETTENNPLAETPYPAQSTDNSTSTNTTPAPSSSGSSGGGSSSPAPQNQTHTVTYDNCFSPTTLTIKNGDTVRFTNNSNKDIWPASDSHPSHSNYPEFDSLNDIEPGNSWSFTFTKTGTWGYHDHNKPFCQGTITVL